MRARSRFLPAVLLPLALALAAPALAATGYAVGDTLPPITAPDQSGAPLALESLRGRWVFLDFCASWCPPCNAMGGEAQAVYDVFADGSLLQFEYVSALVQGPTTAPSTQADAQAWASGHSLSRPILHCGGAPGTSPQHDFALAGFTAVPTGLFVDPDGVVQQVTVGYLSPADLVTRLSALAGLPVAPPPPPPPVLPKCPSLAGATFSVTIGTATDASGADAPGADPLIYSGWSGAFGAAEVGQVQSQPIDINLEGLQMLFGNGDFSPLSRTLPVTFELGGMSWPDGLPRKGSVSNPKAQLSAYVDLGGGNFNLVGTSALLTETHPDGHTLRVGPFTLGSIAGLPQNVFALEVDAILERDYSLAVLDAAPAATSPKLVFAAPWPNPARTAVLLAWSSPAEVAASVQVYDLAGRLVARPRVLHAGASGARAAWNLEDLAGGRVHPGVYLARVTAGGRAATRRVVVIE